MIPIFRRPFKESQNFHKFLLRVGIKSLSNTVTTAMLQVLLLPVCHQSTTFFVLCFTWASSFCSLEQVAISPGPPGSDWALPAGDALCASWLQMRPWQHVPALSQVLQTCFQGLSEEDMGQSAKHSSTPPGTQNTVTHCNISVGFYTLRCPSNHLKVLFNLTIHPPPYKINNGISNSPFWAYVSLINHAV